MKQKTVDKVVMLYKFWSATLLTIFIFVSGYRMEVFYTWWIGTAVLMMYLLINVLYLANLKKKLFEERLKELIHERNERFSRCASKSKRFINNSHEAIYIDKK